MFCTLQRCTGIEHMYCGSTAPQSKGLFVSSDEAVIDELGCAASYDHKLTMFYEHMFQSAATICSKCHPVVLALMFCTTERCTYFQSTSITGFVCVESNAAVNGELGSAAHCIFDWTSWLSKQSQAVCMRPNYIKHPDMLALVSCTSECCTWTGHICCGCSAQQSQGMYHNMKQWLMIWDAQHTHHQCITLSDHVVSFNSHPIQQVPVHQAPSCACIDVARIWALHWKWAHTLWFQCSSVTRSVSSNPAVSEELHSVKGLWLRGAQHISSPIYDVLWTWCLGQQPPCAANPSHQALRCACIAFLHIWAPCFDWVSHGAFVWQAVVLQTDHNGAAWTKSHCR